MCPGGEQPSSSLARAGFCPHYPRSKDNLLPPISHPAGQRGKSLFLSCVCIALFTMGFQSTVGHLDTAEIQKITNNSAFKLKIWSPYILRITQNCKYWMAHPTPDKPQKENSVRWREEEEEERGWKNLLTEDNVHWLFFFFFFLSLNRPILIFTAFRFLNGL